jgi:hypothetical protein
MFSPTQVDRAREKFVSQRVNVAKDNSWKEGIVELVDHCAEQGLVPAVTLPAAPGYMRHVWPKTKVGGWIHKWLRVVRKWFLMQTHQFSNKSS